jgi:hypothetical protein
MTETMSHTDRLAASLNKAFSKSFGKNQWGERHCAAFTRPSKHEIAIVKLIEGAVEYADRHQARYDSAIGDDCVLGKEWESIVRAIRGLLNGECGRLDCGTIDGLLLDMLKAEGFDEE